MQLNAPYYTSLIGAHRRAQQAAARAARQPGFAALLAVDDASLDEPSEVCEAVLKECRAVGIVEDTPLHTATAAVERKARQSSAPTSTAIVPYRPQPSAEHKPRGWKPVPCTKENVDVAKYTRAGTKDGKLATVSVGAHCRHPPSKK